MTHCQYTDLDFTYRGKAFDQKISSLFIEISNLKNIRTKDTTGILSILTGPYYRIFMYAFMLNTDAFTLQMTCTALVNWITNGYAWHCNLYVLPVYSYVQVFRHIFWWVYDTHCVQCASMSKCPQTSLLLFVIFISYFFLQKCQSIMWYTSIILNA